MSYSVNSSELKKIKNVKKHYQGALEYLSDYDRDSINKLNGNSPRFVLSVDECVEIIEAVTERRCTDEDKTSVKKVIGAIYQSFLGEEVYPTVEEKAVNLLYFLMQENSVLYNNRENAVIVFMYFLDKNGLLFDGGEKKISDKTIVLMTIALSLAGQKNKEKVIKLITNFLIN